MNSAGFHERAERFDEARAILERAVALADGDANDPQAAIDALAVRCDLGDFIGFNVNTRKPIKSGRHASSKLLQLAQAHRDDRDLQKKICHSRTERSSSITDAVVCLLWLATMPRESVEFDRVAPPPTCPKSLRR